MRRWNVNELHLLALFHFHDAHVCFFWFKQAVSNLWVAFSAANRPNQNAAASQLKPLVMRTSLRMLYHRINRPNEMDCIEIRFSLLRLPFFILFFSQMLLASLLPHFLRKKGKKNPVFPSNLKRSRWKQSRFNAQQKRREKLIL